MGEKWKELSTAMTVGEFLEAAKDPENAILRETPEERLLRAIGKEGWDVLSPADLDAIEDQKERERQARRLRAFEVSADKPLRFPRTLKQFIDLEPEIVKLCDVLESAASKAEHSRQMIVLRGQPGTAKSQLALTLHNLLRDEPIWKLQGCGMHETPFLILPRSAREKWTSEVGRLPIQPTADICAKCRKTLMQDFEDGKNWREFRVVFDTISMRRGVGSGILFPTDPLNADVTTLIGRQNLAMLDRKDLEEGDPETLLWNGLFHMSSQGLFEIREIFEVGENPEMLNIFMFATQEKIVPGPGNFGNVSVNCVILGHSNVAASEKFFGSSKNEGLKKRFVLIDFPYRLRWEGEVEIQEQHLDRSDYARAHRAPYLLSTLGKYAVATRLGEGHEIPLDVILGIYNGNIEAGAKPSELKMKSRDDGWVGLDSRFFMKVLGLAYAEAGRFRLTRSNPDLVGIEKRCVSWPEVRAIIVRELREAREYNDQERQSIEKALEPTDEWYATEVRGDLWRTIIGAQSDFADEHFRLYLDQARRWMEFQETNGSDQEVAAIDALLKKFEREMGFGSDEGQGVRETLVEIANRYFETQRTFRWQEHEEIRRGIERLLIGRMRDFFAVPTDADKDPWMQEAYERIKQELLQIGYCSVCVDKALRLAREQPHRYF